ncbi:MAG: glycosyltransferase family 39 protein, partial [Bryobacteraceae bacterium]|nr:glycosyltransferase family 39 protein [Bryobacteraceae bacterium]
MSPVVILLSAAFTGLTSVSLGLITLKSLRLQLRRGETLPLAFVLGSAFLSTIIFFFLTFSIVKPWTLGAVSVIAIAVCIHRRAWRLAINEEPHVPIPSMWRWVFGLALFVYGGYTFIYALAPETSPDGVAYHLGTVDRYFRAGGFQWYTGNMYANLPMGVELLFLHAYSFGRHSAAALVHWQFLMVLPLAVLAIGRRFGNATAAVIAALLVFLSPVVLIDGSCAYVDVAASCVITGLFLSLVIWEQEQQQNWFYVIGIVAGFAYCCKLTSAPAVLLALLYVGITLWRRGQFTLRPLLLVGTCAFVLIAPWLVKNTLIAGNPVSPFLNRWFPNPNVRISFEEKYREDYRTIYGAFKNWTQIPLEATVIASGVKCSCRSRVPTAST